MESIMSEPSVDLISFASSQADNLSISLRGNSCQLPETSNLGVQFNIDMNKTFDLNKYAEHPKASSKIETTLETFNKHTFDYKKQNALRRLSEVESLESDESLGLLPDSLINDEMTYDFFKTELSSNEIHEELESEINQNPASFVFSPPSDNQFNRISLFLKNISTPLPNFGNPRRLSSTPKVPGVTNILNSENYSSPNFLPDEKEEPIAGSCYFKFETDINFDLNHEKPLTSTYKTVPPLQLSHILNELNEETDLKSEENLKNKPEGVQNNLNTTQIFSHNVEDLLSYHEDSIQSINALNNTFKIKQSAFKESADAFASLKHCIPNTMKELATDCSEKEKVKTLDSTFAIPYDKVICNKDCEKTFVIDFNSAIATDVSSNCMVKDSMVNETCVDYVASFSKKQENIADVTFVKYVENDTRTNLENHCYNFQGEAFKPKQILEETFFYSDFKPMKPILEETLSENNFNETKVYSKNVQCFNSESESKSSEILKMKVSEKIENFTGIKVTQVDSYLTECASPNSPKTFSNNSEIEEKNCLHDQINLAEKENDCFLEKSPLVSLQLGSNATFSKEIFESVDQEIVGFHKSDTTENINSMIELASDKSQKILSNTTFISLKENSHKDQIDLSKSKNDSVNKVLNSDPLELFSNTVCDERTFEKSAEKIGVFYEKSSLKSENVGEFASFTFPKISKSFIFPDKSEAANSLKSSVFQDSNEQGAPSFSIAIKDSTVTENSSKETELCDHSISKEDSFGILSKSSNMCTNTVFLEKSDMDLISAANSQVQISQNLGKTTDGTFSEKIDEVKIEPKSILTENDEFLTDSNLMEEIADSASFKFEKDVKIQPPELENSQRDEDAFDVSPREAKSCFSGVFFRKAADKVNSLKSCSLEPKSGLIKPAKIVHTKKVSDLHNGQLPIVKPVIHKRSIISNLNCSLRLNNSTDKSFSKDLNKRTSLSCSSASEANKSECKNGFKKPFGIPLKSNIKKPDLKFQKSRMDSKSSIGHLKDVKKVIDKQNVLTQPDLISSKNPKMVKSVATDSVNTKGSMSSRLSIHEKFSLNSLKIKENGFKSNVAVAYTPEKSKTISRPTVTDPSKNENLPETDNFKNKHSRHSIATSLPRKFVPLNNSNKTFNSKPIATKQTSAPVFNSPKPCLLKVPDNMKRHNSVVKNKFSLLPKVQSHIKISSYESEDRSVVNKRLESENIKSNGLRKPCVPEAAQFVKTSISTDHLKQKDNTREKTQSASSMFPTSKEQAEKPSSSLIARRIPGKLPQPRKIPAPNYKK